VREALRVAWDLATLGEASHCLRSEPQTAPTVDILTVAALARRHGRSRRAPFQLVRRYVGRRWRRAPRGRLRTRLTTEHR
jgi:hypothetical protein